MDTSEWFYIYQATKQNMKFNDNFTYKNNAIFDVILNTIAQLIECHYT